MEMTAETQTAAPPAKRAPKAKVAPASEVAPALSFVVEREPFEAALGKVVGVVARRATLSILSNVLLTTERGYVNIKATDLDMEGTVAVPAQATSKAAVTVPGHTLHDIVRRARKGASIAFELSPGESRLKIKSGRSDYEIATLPATDFPNLERDEPFHEFSLGATLAARLFSKPRFAVSTEETRYYLNGIYMHAFQGKLRGVATDGHRLALVDIDLPEGADKTPGVILPRPFLDQAIKLVSGAEGEVAIGVNKNQVRLKAGDVTLLSKLIAGDFPDYQRVIPEGKFTATVAKEELADAIERVTPMASEPGVKIEFKQGVAILSTSNSEIGRGADQIDAEYEDAPIEIGFNAKYLLDILKQIDGEKAVINLINGYSPTTFLDGDVPDTLFVCMPMRA